MKPYLIAEIGINHNGDINLAKKLIKDASDAGFDAVKFQKRTVEKVYTKEFLDSPRESPWGNTQRDQKNGIEFSYDDYKIIDEYCGKLGIDWSASSWDEDAQIFLRKFKRKFNKIASAMLSHKPLLRLVAEEKIKTFISTGMSTTEEIADAIEIFKKADCPFELMHCNSSYPMDEKDANLSCIQTLKKKFGCDVGYSGHEASLLKVCLTAVVLGATSIERHITADRAMYGSDQSASVESQHLKSFVTAIRAVPELIGDGVKKITKTELKIREKLRIAKD